VSPPPFPLLGGDYRKKNVEGNRFSDVTRKPEEKNKHLSGVYGWYYPLPVELDPYIGIYNPKLAQCRTIQRTVDRIVFDVIYTFDLFGRRYTPDPARKEQDRFLILTGCSITFGAGLNDHETLNAHLARDLKKHYPYNYGVIGSGPNTALSIVETGRLKKEIYEKEGTFVYVDLGYVDRTVPKLPGVLWTLKAPNYVIEKGQLMRKGFFDDHWIVKYLKAFNKFQVFLGLPTDRILVELSIKCAMISLKTFRPRNF
jgi:hypothetical protein